VSGTGFTDGSARLTENASLACQYGTRPVTETHEYRDISAQVLAKKTVERRLHELYDAKEKYGNLDWERESKLKVSEHKYFHILFPSFFFHSHQ
jgi:hypothetical protein